MLTLKTARADFTRSPVMSGAVMGALVGQMDSGLAKYAKAAESVLQDFAAELPRLTVEKTAASQRAFEELTTEPTDLLEEMREAKLASASDEQLLSIAEGLPGDTLETYEALGGEFKVAFGTPMFSTNPTPPAGGGAGGGLAPMGAPKLQSPRAAGPQRPSVGQGVGAGASINPIQTPSTPDVSGASPASGIQ